MPRLGFHLWLWHFLDFVLDILLFLCEDHRFGLYNFFFAQWTMPSLLNGRVRFLIKRRLVKFVHLDHLFSIEILVSKKCRPWSDAEFCGVWSGLHRLPRSQNRHEWVRYRPCVHVVGMCTNITGRGWGLRSLIVTLHSLDIFYFFTCILLESMDLTFTGSLFLIKKIINFLWIKPQLRNKNQRPKCICRLFAKTSLWTGTITFVKNVIGSIEFLCPTHKNS